MQKLGEHKIDYARVLDFYRGKKVLVTGNTGFKGAWLTYMLASAGASITGYALNSNEEQALFHIAALESCPNLQQIYADIRDLESLQSVFKKVQPEIVFHMAAQPIVRVSYKNPVATYSTNVMGTVNVCEAIRQTPSVRSFLNVTTDKVYKNKEWVYGYRETDTLDGLDPYSNSKSCSELVTHSYRDSFFENRRISVSSARAGNVIGGGDFAKDRIIPDCVRAALRGETIIVRNPCSTRPYQHVLEALFAYLMIAAKQYGNKKYAGSYNVGPDDHDCWRTEELVDAFVACWGDNIQWAEEGDGGPHEASFLKLDCSKLKSSFNWCPRWNLSTAVQKVVEWTKWWYSGKDVRVCMDKQIEEFVESGQAGSFWDEKVF